MRHVDLIIVLSGVPLFITHHGSHISEDEVMILTTNLKRALCAIACALAAFQVSAQAFPSKAITFVVPYPAGGPSDFVARQLQPQLNKHLAQTIIVENVGGAGGAIGIQKVLGAPHDGYNIVLGTPMELVLAPLGIASAKFKPEDIKLIGRVGTTSMVLLTRKDLPANNLTELIAVAKQRNGLSYGSVGPGSLYHLVGEKFAQVTGAKLLHVPYKGAAPLVSDLLGGQIDMVFMPFAGNIPGMIADGKVKAMGLTTKTPNPRHPQLVAIAAQKGFDGFEFDLWAAVGVPKNTPEDVAARLRNAFYDALQNPETRKALEATGTTLVAPMSLDELARMYTAETARYQAIAKSINLQPQ